MSGFDGNTNKYVYPHVSEGRVISAKGTREEEEEANEQHKDELKKIAKRKYGNVSRTAKTQRNEIKQRQQFNKETKLGGRRRTRRRGRKSKRKRKSRRKRNTKRKRGGMDGPIARSGAQELSGSNDDDAEHDDHDEDHHVAQEEEERGNEARQNAMRNLGNPDFVQNSNRQGEYIRRMLQPQSSSGVHRRHRTKRKKRKQLRRKQLRRKQSRTKRNTKRKRFRKKR